jgi:hypothetical protein
MHDPAAVEVLAALLRERPEPLRASDPGEWWRRFCALRPDLSVPIDRALLGGLVADRLGFAFAGGYEAALRALVPALPPGAIASFCATEEGGNHPRAIEARLAPDAAGGATLTGSKRWSTMAPLASILLVVAVEGRADAPVGRADAPVGRADAAGRKRFRLVAVNAAAPGVRITAMPPPRFVPEVPHAAIELDAVAIAPDALLPGDGYTRYVKPFRTVEDLHVHGAVLGYLLSVARRHGFPHVAIERLVSSAVTVRTLALLDPAAPEVHVALAGLLAEGARLLDALEPEWARVGEAERARWQRDRGLFGSVAGQVRERRRQRAWEALDTGPARLAP